MKQKSLLIFSGLLLSLPSSSFAAVSILDETFTGASSTATVITGVEGAWSASTYKGPVGNPVDSATVATSLGNNAGNNYAILTTNFPSTTANTGWLGGEIRLTNVLNGSELNDYNLADLTFSIDLAATSTGPLQYVNIELRQSAGITHVFRPTPLADGAWGTYTFNLDNNKSGGFTGFADGPVTLYIQATHIWGVNGSPVTVSYNLDNIQIIGVPEVSTTLLGFAAVPVLLRRRRIG